MASKFPRETDGLSAKPSAVRIDRPEVPMFRKEKLEPGLAIPPKQFYTGYMEPHRYRLLLQLHKKTIYRGVEAKVISPGFSSSKIVP